MDALTLLTEDARWAELELEPLAGSACGAVLEALGIDASLCEVTLLACDDRRIAALNADFRGRAAPTNVLSWPFAERAPASPGGIPQSPTPDAFGVLELGDIAISYETCRAEAEAAGKPLKDHVTHLIVHGMLHLLGYDHETEADARVMEGLEVEILGKMGQDDPYREQ